MSIFLETLDIIYLFLMSVYNLQMASIYTDTTYVAINLTLNQLLGNECSLIQEFYSSQQIHTYFNFLFIIGSFCLILNAINSSLVILTSELLAWKAQLVFFSLKHGAKTFIASLELGLALHYPRTYLLTF